MERLPVYEVRVYLRGGEVRVVHHFGLISPSMLFEIIRYIPLRFVSLPPTLVDQAVPHTKLILVSIPADRM
jgi:hypothetical protein